MNYNLPPPKSQISQFNHIPPTPIRGSSEASCGVGENSSHWRAEAPSLQPPGAVALQSCLFARVKLSFSIKQEMPGGGRLLAHLLNCINTRFQISKTLGSS